MTGRLTDVAQQAVRSVLCPGDLAVDATAGNGHDTLFLAEAVGPTGHVIAFDIQAAAIAATGERLRSSACEARVELVEGCHSALGEMLPEGAELRAAMFNLGYLPGSDKQAITQAATTLPALATCLERIAPGGIISLMAYRGHPGGEEESASIARLVEDLDAQRFAIEKHTAPGTGPVLWLVRRRAQKM